MQCHLFFFYLVFILFCSLLYFVFCLFCFNITYNSTAATACIFQFCFVFSSLFSFQVLLLHKTGARAMGRYARAISSRTVVLRPLHVLRGWNFGTFSLYFFFSFSFLLVVFSFCLFSYC
jgi:hypothetical protein